MAALLAAVAARSAAVQVRAGAGHRSGVSGTRRVVLATTHAGFALSRLAHLTLRQWGHVDPESLPRDDPDLVQVVEDLGGVGGGSIFPDLDGHVATNWGTSHLRVAEIPAEVDWVIEDYDGAEWIVTAARWTEEGPLDPGEAQPWRRSQDRP